MSKLSKQRAKEKFLKNITEVDKDVILEELKKSDTNTDLYSYFIGMNAFNETILTDKDVNEFLLRAYSDWYFLHKNTRRDTENPLLNQFAYIPVNLNGDKCLQLIRGGEFDETLPIYFQHVNKLEETFFMCIETDRLYNKEFKNAEYDVRLYLNLPVYKALEFAKEFLDKAYLDDFPALIKVLNNDHRCDTITIYTDYEYAQKVIDIIEEIKYEMPTIFAQVGKVNPLLGTINEYIGFGEQNDGTTYFTSRTRALSCIQEEACRFKLKEGIVAEEKQIIFRSDGSKFTASEYLAYLIEKNAIKLIENRIAEIEKETEDETPELSRLYLLRDNVNIGLDMTEEVSNLKRALTRKTNYKLAIDEVGESDYDFVSKLYRLFTTEEERCLKTRNERQKKGVIANKIFHTTETFEGVSTREFLETYFKTEIALLLKEALDYDITCMKRTKQSAVITNIRKKAALRLRSILNSIVDDGDEGREYVGLAVNDYIRILSSGSTENVEVSIDNKTLSIDKDVNMDIISLLPRLKEEINELSINIDFIDRTLQEFGINKDNLCLNNTTKHIKKEKTLKSESESECYYNPDGYLSK